LANELSRHAQIHAVTDAPNRIVESAWFSYLHGRYGPLDNPRNLDRLLAAMGKTVYWRSAGITLEQVRHSAPTDYPALFRRLMDDLAVENGCSRWLEKTPTHTMFARELARLFPDAQFVGIRRDPLDRVSSAVRMYPPATSAGLRRQRLVLESIKTGVYDAVLRDFAAHNPRCLMIQYAQLRTARLDTLRRVLRFLKLPEVVEPNPIQGARSSFASAGEKANYLSPGEQAIVRVLYRSAAAVPGRTYRQLYGTYLRLRPPGDPGGFWAEEPTPADRGLRRGTSAFRV
jgi:hypothetical protein